MRYTEDQKKDFVNKQKELGLTAQGMADKFGFGKSSFVLWKSKYGKKSAKRKTAVKATPIKKTSTKTEEQAWETLFNKFFFHRDESEKHRSEAEKARKELQDYVERLR
jgi:hypothetical protein